MDRPWGLNWTVLIRERPSNSGPNLKRGKPDGLLYVSLTLFDCPIGLSMSIQLDSNDRPVWLKLADATIYFQGRSLSPHLTVHFRPGLFWGAYLFHSVHKWSFHTILCEVRPTVPPVIEFALFQSVYYYSPNLTHQLFRPSISNMFHPFRDRILNLFVNKSQNHWFVSK